MVLEAGEADDVSDQTLPPLLSSPDGSRAGGSFLLEKRQELKVGSGFSLERRLFLLSLHEGYLLPFV